MRDTIDMAREAGIKYDLDGVWCDVDQLKAFETFVRADEREALLEIVYSYSNSLSWNDDFQDAIRARGNT